jgi:pimeloyl-ACP methyl ester carboxylesterase
MPRRNHKKSRTLFINEAKKLNQQEFIRWFKLASEVNPLLKYFRNTPLTLPSLYVMGSQDAMFLPSIKKLVNKYPKTCALAIAPNCGHVVNIDQPDYFNKKAIAFIKHIGN